MKNVQKTKKCNPSRDIFAKYPTFKMGYIDAFQGNSYRQAYEQMNFSGQLWYEQGRLCATNLKSIGVAPMWRPQVTCPRDLIRLINEHGIGI